MIELPDALKPLSAYNQFIIYRVQPSVTRPGKTDKLPVNLSGINVNAHDSNVWMSATDAIATATHWGEPYGVGFVFTHDDPFFFVDVDDCEQGGAWSNIANDLLTRFPGAAVELSTSGKGLHIIGKYAGDEPAHRCKNIPLNLELYTAERFVALTGLQAMGDASTDHTERLNVTINDYFPLDPNDPGDFTVRWTDGPREGTNPITDDDALLAKAMKSQSTASAMGGRASFKELWTADEEALSKFWPDDGGQGRGYDASSADAALASHLAFWTCGDCARTEKLMRQSKLVRDKWDDHKNYMKITIGGMCSRQTSFYSANDPIENIEVEELTLREGFQLMPPPQQMEYFKNCVYVAEVNRIFMPNGSLLKSEQFNAMCGGFTFSMDTTGERSTRKAWECFTESQAVNFPKADGFCFRPDLDTGAVIEDEGLKVVNTYVPIDIHMSEGDIEPFMKHLAKVLPNERDQTILISYMAACIQFKGKKIQWAPLLQGVEGNGKTLFSRCVAYAIGERYSHWPPADEIAEKFNSWLFNTLFIGVEDIYVPDHRNDIINKLKPMITSERLARRAMQTDQVMHNVCCNFIFNSNYKDAIRKTKNDRRYCVFYTAQQDEEDLARDGMSGDYFPELYDWLKDVGYARVAHFLANFPIPDEFNPNTQCQVAPRTSTTDEAISNSLGGIEQEVQEAIDEGRVGFMGGWVSSKALDNLLNDIRKASVMPRTKRVQMMERLGYILHPGLTKGRVNTALMIDGGSKPRLYVHKNNPDMLLTRPPEIAARYSACQGDPIP